MTSKFVIRIPFVSQDKITLTLGVKELSRIQRAEHVSRMGGNRNVYRILVERTAEKIVLVGPDLRRNDYVKIGIEQNGSEDVDCSIWFKLDQ